MSPPHNDIHQVRLSLLTWFRKKQRALPWRETKDPYAIWVSEIMLQQTRVATAIDYYLRWMENFPTLGALAAADEHAVLKNWEGLGYYSRARNLQAAARKVVEDLDGKMPATAAGLQQLPGIGPYTAGAVASIAFDLPEPAVDGNVNRVICRLFCLEGNPLKTPLKKDIWQRVKSLLPKRGAGEFNQALMELGASHCSPRKPDCLQCPVHDDCLARKADRAHDLPQTAPRAAITKERHALAIVRRRGRVLLLRAPSNAPRWAGLWVFPSTKVSAKASPQPTLASYLSQHLKLPTQVGPSLFCLQHFVTRFDIALEVFEAPSPKGAPQPADGWEASWHSAKALRNLAMPAPHRRIEERLR